MHFRFLLIFLFLASVEATGQHVNFEFFTTAQGLSSDRVWSVCQGPNGFLWVSTDALNRYDGYRFINYNTHDAPILARLSRSAYTQALDNRLFFLTENNLVCYDLLDGSRRQFSLEAFTLNRLHINPGMLLRLVDTSLLIPMFEQGHNQVTLIRFHDDELETLARVDDILVNALDFTFELAEDPAGYLYFINAAATTLVQMDRQGRVIHTFDLPASGEWPFIKTGTGSPIHVILGNRIFSVDPVAGALVPSPVNQQLLSSGANKIKDLIETGEGDFWITGSDRFLAFFDVTNNRLTDFSAEVRQHIPYRVDLGKIFMDSGGVLWIQTISGLLKVSPQRILFDTYFADKNTHCGGYCSFRGLAEDPQGNLYAAYYNNIFVIRPDGKTDSSPLLPLDHTPFDITVVGERLILNNGYVYDLRRGELGNPYQSVHGSNDIGALCRGPDGQVWWAYRKDVYALGSGNAPVWEVRLSLPERDFINDLKYDPRQKVFWLSLWHALVRFDPASQEISRYDHSVLGDSPSIHYILPGPGGVIWLATERGLLRFSPETGSVVRYTTVQGLPNNFVVGILPEGDSCLWLSTHSGLSRFRLADASFTNFLQDDGLADNEFNRHSLLISRSGKFYFGGTHGLTVFDPVTVMQTDRNAKSTGRISMTAWAKTDTRSGGLSNSIFHPANEPLILRHSNKSLQVEVALTDFRGVGKAQFSYMIAGFNEIWSSPSPSNHITFNALPAGDYTLHVRALGSNGRWHPSVLRVPITVYPPWWKTSLAFILYGLAFLALGVGILSFYKRRWQLQLALELQQKEATRLQEMDDFKSRVYTNLTHEFRTPLTVILGMARELAGTSSARVDEAGRLIEKNGQNLLRIINQLLDLSKLESRALTLHLVQGNLIAFAGYLMDSFRSYNESLHLTLRLDTNVDELWMDFDPVQLQQVFTNLLSNALKFTPPGGEVQVIVKEDGGEAVITVKDTGIGISREDLPHIFERFYQADLPSVRAGHGTGIGLAHTQELVKLMGGTITVESSPGEGSRFTIRLPIRRTATVQADPYPLDLAAIPGRTWDASDPAMPVNSGPTVLVIEDNRDVVQYLHTCLGGKYPLLVAYSGQEGIDLAMEHIPDLVISDVMMPGKDGFAVCDELKNDMRTSHIPILLLTGRADTASRITGIRRGADVFLAKPFDKEELLVHIEKLLERQRRMTAWLTKKIQGETPPVEPDYEEAVRVEDAFIRRVREIVAARYTDESFALPDLCLAIGMSRSQLFRKMTALVNTSPSEFIRRFRLQQARDLLQTTDLTVSEVAWQVGFKDPSHFSKVFQESFGVAPSDTRK